MILQMRQVINEPVINPHISSNTSVIQPFLPGTKCWMVSSKYGVKIQNNKKLTLLFLSNGSN